MRIRVRGYRKREPAARKDSCEIGRRFLADRTESGEIAPCRTRFCQKMRAGRSLALDGLERRRDQAAFARLGRGGLLVLEAPEHISVLLAIRVDERAALFLCEDQL